jgi:hypothetical protein
MISEWAIEAGTARPNTLVMNDFNILTINGKVFPSTAPPEEMQSMSKMMGDMSGMMKQMSERMGRGMKKTQ